MHGYAEKRHEHSRTTCFVQHSNEGSVFFRPVRLCCPLPLT
uniref:Uncharacterized protein n=1 Tax=Ascaris lumbricoides TaxID=6252 RepID=A0A0M3HJB7_ASCLU